MAAASGKLFLLRLKNDAATPVFVAVAGLRTKEISFNQEIVDVTNTESVGNARELLGGVGVHSASFSGSGVATDKPTLVLLQDMAFDKSLRDGEVTVPGVGVFTGKFAVASYKLAGEHNGAIMFDASFESSGPLVFTVEP